jgi:hypothetical protein
METQNSSSRDASLRGLFPGHRDTFFPLVITQMDAATAALRGCEDTKTINITARAKENGVHMTTLWHRNNGRPSIKDRAPTQQYLTPSEEKALVKFLLQMANHGTPVRIKFLPSLAFGITHQRSRIKL